MAAARAETEEYTSRFSSCLDEFGVTYDVAAGGAVTTVTRVDESGQAPPGIAELNTLAMTECDERVPPPSSWSAPADEDAYRRMVDVRNCIVAQGHDLPEPPSLEVWLDQHRPWMPYEQLTLGFAELQTLMEQCPQSGTRMFFRSPDAQ